VTGRIRRDTERHPFFPARLSQPYRSKMAKVTEPEFLVTLRVGHTGAITILNDPVSSLPARQVLARIHQEVRYVFSPQVPVVGPWETLEINGGTTGL
jgi:hypothetical protein